MLGTGSTVGWVGLVVGWGVGRVGARIEGLAGGEVDLGVTRRGSRLLVDPEVGERGVDDGDGYAGGVRGEFVVGFGLVGDGLRAGLVDSVWV